MSVDPKKVEAICSIAPPQNISELTRHLNYCSKMIREPLRELTRKSAKWQWTDHQQTASDMIKGILSSNPILAFFIQTKVLVHCRWKPIWLVDLVVFTSSVMKIYVPRLIVMLADHLVAWSVDISKQNVRPSLLFGDVNASTCIFMVHHL